MPSFHSNTAMICHNCCRAAIVRLALIFSDGKPVMLSWIDGAPMVLRRGDGSPVIASVELSQAQDNSSPVLDTLDVFFISCVGCLEFGGVHNPKKAFFSKHIDARTYGDIISHLGYMLGCSPKVPEIWALMATLKIKCVTRIRDESEVLDMSIIPARNIMIIDNGEEVTKNCRFFSHEPYGLNRERTRYPQGSLSEKDAWTMQFASVANRPPLARSSMDLVHHECLLDIGRDVPPSYDSGSEDVKAPLLEFAA